MLLKLQHCTIVMYNVFDFILSILKIIEGNDKRVNCPFSMCVKNPAKRDN